MKKSTLIIVVFVFVVVASFSFITSDVPKYKNLKILKKNISEKEMDSVMHFFSRSVGKKCNFCHVRNEEEKSMDFVSDANPHKQITRKMMLMTNKINKRYFSYEKKSKNDLIQSVTCYTCHNGQPHPETKLKMSPEDSLKKLSSDSAGKKDKGEAPQDSSKRFQGDTMNNRQ